MKLRWRHLPRGLTTRLHFLLDECLPPIVRDQRWFMYAPFRLFFGDRAGLFLEFKETAPRLNETELAAAYAAVRPVVPQRTTDLNARCLESILTELRGQTVLDVGSGRGYLSGRMSQSHTVVAVDLLVEPAVPAKYPQVRFVAGNIVRLPFGPRAFDTVVCTHTLEHVQELFQAIQELRRVTRQRLIIVVPKQRPYRYTFDLHVHFFPYPSTLRAIMNPGSRPARCDVVGGDLLYVEDVEAHAGAVGELSGREPDLRVEEVRQGV